MRVEGAMIELNVRVRHRNFDLFVVQKKKPLGYPNTVKDFKTKNACEVCVHMA